MSDTVELLAANAGTSLRDVARQWPVYKRRLKEKTIRNRIARIRHVMRHGGANIMTAQRLGKLLNCDAGLFLYGEAFLQKGTPKVSLGGGGE